MLALLYKDLLLLKREKSTWILLPLAILAGPAACAGSLASAFMVFFVMFFALSLLTAYDFKYGCETAVASLPVARSAIVQEKYVFTLLFSLAACLVASFFGGIASLTGLSKGAFPPGFLLVAMSINALLGAIFLWSYFRFGYLRSRWVLIGLVAIPSAVVGALGGAKVEGMTNLWQQGGFVFRDPAILLGLGLAAAILYALSFLSSTRRVLRKEF